MHLPWADLRFELSQLSPFGIAIAVACIYAGYWLRALRWKLLLPRGLRADVAPILSAQVIGFTAVALFGRVADLARPFLIARRVGTPASTQLAIYSLDRAFDLSAAAILFSATLLFAPRNAPHHDAFSHAGLASAAATLLLAGFVAALRWHGESLTSGIERAVRPLSPKLAAALTVKIDGFRHGLAGISDLRTLGASLLLSLGLWGGIAAAYFLVAHSFRACPPLATLSVTATMLLLAASMGSSLLQLPVLGWFTQIAALAAALHTLFAVPLGPATACGLMLLAATTLCVIPAGLLAAKLSGTTLRAAARSSASA